MEDVDDIVDPLLLEQEEQSIASMWYWYFLWGLGVLYFSLSKIIGRMDTSPVIREGERSVRWLGYFAVLMIFGFLMSLKLLFASPFVTSLTISLIFILFFWSVIIPNIPLYFDHWDYTSPIGLSLLLTSLLLILTASFLSIVFFFSTTLTAIICTLLLASLWGGSLCFSARLLSSYIGNSKLCVQQNATPGSPAKFPKGGNEIETVEMTRQTTDARIAEAVRIAYAYERGHVMGRAKLVARYLGFVLVFVLALVLPEFITAVSSTLPGFAYAALCTVAVAANLLSS